MLTTGLDGGRMITSAPAMASSTPGAGDASAAPANTKPAAGTCAPIRTHHSWKCTVCPPSSPASTTWVSTRSSDIGSSRTPGRQRWQSTAVSRRERQPGRQHAGPVQVGRDVEVTQAEPARPGTVGGKLGQDRTGVTGPAPALLLVDAAAEGVHDGVQVGGHVQAEQRDVVAGVADDGNLGVRYFRFQPAQEPGGPDSARGHGDAHAGKSGNRPGPVPPHPRKTAHSTPPRPVKSQVFWPGFTRHPGQAGVNITDPA